MRAKTTAVLSLAFLAFAAAARTADKPLEIYWIDVEGGAATLIVTPAGESVLIDAGNPGGRDAARIHRVATESAGLKRIDHLLVTHFHRDHFGGVAELAKLMPVGTLHERDLLSAPEGEQRQPELEAYKTAAVERRTTVKPGMLSLRQAQAAPPLSLEVLGANGEFPAKPTGRDLATECRTGVSKAADPSDNRNSVVTRLSFGPFRFFDGGDLTWNAEADLVCPQDRVGPVDVFQIDHHGLDASNNPLLLRAVAPSVVVVNNGPRKGGEPGSFAAVQATPSVQAVYQLHRNVRAPEANTLEERIANEAEECAAGFVKLSVEPDGRRYSIEVPSTGHRKSYVTRTGPAVARAAARVELLAREAERRVDVSIDGAPFTAYLWPESQAKHVLWPIRTAKGTEVTRGYPLAPKVGEKVDHPHHVGLWLNYGDVNGVDFWGNAMAASRNQSRMGRIAHRKILEAKGGDLGRLVVAADWVMPDGSVALEETTAFAFGPLPDGRLIERTTTLRAKGAVVFKDTKEGMFGLRVARSLEHPASPKEKGAVVGPDYRPTPSAPLDNTGITGVYHSSEGKTGDAVWGTRARWVALSGHVGEEDVVIAILDHPKNPNAPTYWHARGYGLFAANPLGQKDFSSGREEMNFSLGVGQSASFRYGVAVLTGAFSEARVEELYQGFSKK